MNKTIELTIQLLAKSKNRAAERLLETALNSSNVEVRMQTGREMLAGRGSRGVSELIRHFDPKDETILDIFRQNRDKTIPALRAAILGTDRRLIRNALRIARTLDFFELIPLLLTVFLERGEEDGDESSLAESILKLLEKYIDALEERRNRRLLYGTILPSLLQVVATGLADYHRNDPKLFLRVYLQLYPYIPDEMPDLLGVLRNPSHTAYQPLYHLLLSERDVHLYGFLFFCLNNEDPPPIALAVFSKRGDIPFLAWLFKQFLEHLTPEFDANLGLIRHLDWTDQLRTIVDQLSEQSQVGLVRLVTHLKLPPSEIQSHLITIFQYGKKSGRRAAMIALAQYVGERVDRILWQAADDADPDVQIEALSMIKKRDLPKATSHILRYVDSPEARVRDTVRKLLPEFRFSRFLETFDQMNDEQRRIMFNIVRKIDTNTVDELARLLMLGDASDKDRALLCVEYGGIVDTLEESLCGVLIKGETPALRSKAAMLLAGGRRELSRGTLVQALHRDPSPEVRDAAKTSLRHRPAPWELARKTQ